MLLFVQKIFSLVHRIFCEFLRIGSIEPNKGDGAGVPFWKIEHPLRPQACLSFPHHKLSLAAFREDDYL